MFESRLTITELKDEELNISSGLKKEITGKMHLYRSKADEYPKGVKTACINSTSKLF
jgi:hypothetical protein